jgi:hypothetical protein
MAGTSPMRIRISGGLKNDLPLPLRPKPAKGEGDPYSATAADPDAYGDKPGHDDEQLAATPFVSSQGKLLYRV